jgi:hypothetical protein
MAGKERYTAQQVAYALTRSHGLTTYAAKILGCTTQTILNYSARYASVREARDMARAGLIDLAELRLMEAVNAGSLPAVFFVLKTLGRGRGYTEHGAITHEVNVYDRTRRPKSLDIDFDRYNAEYQAAVNRAFDAGHNPFAEGFGPWPALGPGDTGDDAADDD